MTFDQVTETKNYGRSDMMTAWTMCLIQSLDSGTMSCG